MAHRPLKRFGQNFLTQPAIAHKIVAALHIDTMDHIIEIGPGKGILSSLIIEKKPAHFTAIEIDNNLSGELKETYPDQLELIEKDFLDIDLHDFFSDAHPTKVIGNIPYNITSPILFKIAGHHPDIECAVFMMQKEVARRIAAQPGTKEYGILSVILQTLARVDYLFDVGRGNFFPAPKVDSAVICFTFRKTIDDVDDLVLFRKIVRAAFNYRRKMIKNSLTRIFDQSIVTSLNDFDLTKRPEQFSTDDFKKLANTIYQITK